ncbi:MAG: glycerol-3-phosphate dehydrogenase/oxidase [Gammaproteobacteria bacterium]|nr:MAG: glycerol-3-phosphate dehydrogenase/oxidase [Gammaproteobacteria bacterium]
MNRDRCAALRGRTYDVIVVGAGIYGATIAFEAARQGLTVAMVERSDFGSQTSANSLKIIHGGLRYLQHLDLRRMRESIRARRALLQEMPHLVRPLQCLMPTQGYALRSRAAMRMALALNDLVSFDRNAGIDTGNRLAAGYTISRQQCAAMLPGMADADCSGAAVWYDAIALDTERLTLEFVQRARDCGATVLNYVRADELITDSRNKVAALAVSDVLDGTALDVRATCVVNATGPWLGALFSRHDPQVGVSEQRLVWAMNLVIRRKLFEGYAVGVAGSKAYRDHDALINKGHRLYFFAPWGDLTMIGTMYREHHGGSDNPVVRAADLKEMMDDINSAYPEARLELDDITYVHSGLLPGASGQSGIGEPQLRKDCRIYGPERPGSIAGLYSVSSVKYTTAWPVARRLVQRLIKENGLRQASSPALDSVDRNTGAADDPGGGIPQRLRERYGTRCTKVFALAAADESPLPDSPVLPVEVKYAIREELACSLEDVVVRRTGIGSFGRPPRRFVEACTGLMAAELGWSDARQEEEIARLDDFYTRKSLPMVRY